MELLVVVFLLLLRTSDLIFWLLNVPKGNISLMHLKQNHGSAQALICWKSWKFKWIHLQRTQILQRSQKIDGCLLSSIDIPHTPHG